jgi:hypothetical protein
MTELQHSALAREPSLDELFAEPIIQLLMQRDGIRRHDMRQHLSRASLHAARHGLGR